jgi:DNA-binding NtrC family response regulator
MTASPAKLVLIVDDEPSITMTTAAILELNGFRTAVANDGATALQMTFELRPHLVLTDVAMPGMNGVQLAIAVQKALPQTKILLFSGNATTADLLASARRRGYNFRLLAKPVPLDEMLHAIKTTLRPQSGAVAA